MAALLLALPLLLALLGLPKAAADTAPSAQFSPKDNILIDCGADTLATLPDGRIFKTDPNSAGYLEAKDNTQISVPNADVPSPIYLTVLVFVSEATYTFHLSAAGWHWIRLHFFPMNNTRFNLQDAMFSVTASSAVLLRRFSVNNSTQAMVKEYLLNMTDPQFSLKFSPVKDSFGFINVIEVVSAPDFIISDSGTSLSPVSEFKDLSGYNYQCLYRLNVGGPLLNLQNDTLGWEWETDDKYIKRKNAGKSVSVPPKVVKYPEDFPTLIAPATVYASAVEMANANVQQPNFNITWDFDVDTSVGYMVRLHFCDIVSKSLNDLYFNVYINGKMAILGLDLSSLTNGLAVPYYKDMVVNSTLMSDGPLSIQIGPMNQDTGTVNAILNGVEVMKMSNSVNSLDGEFGVDGQKAG